MTSKQLARRLAAEMSKLVSAFDNTHVALSQKLGVIDVEELLPIAKRISSLERLVTELGTGKK